MPMKHKNGSNRLTDRLKPAKKNKLRDGEALFFQNRVPYLFTGDVVGNRKGYTTFSATAGENLATVLGGHSQTKTVLVDSSAVGGLKSPFHFY